MNHHKIQPVLIMALVVLLIGALIGAAACKVKDNTANALINKPAPDFNLKDLDGRSVSLRGFLGKTVLIDFWMTTSPSCVDELPIFKELNEEWSDRNDVVFLSIDLGEDADKVQLFTDHHDLTFPVLLDASWEAANAYQIHTTPTCVLVDSRGYLKFAVVGAFKDQAALNAQLTDFIPAQP